MKLHPGACVVSPSPAHCSAGLLGVSSQKRSCCPRETELRCSAVLCGGLSPSQVSDKDGSDNCLSLGGKGI